tara:strand:- start:263 stop:556 length:294 start_codon:yes stop_codon:yes gene_type:complete
MLFFTKPLGSFAILISGISVLPFDAGVDDPVVITKFEAIYLVVPRHAAYVFAVRTHGRFEVFASDGVRGFQTRPFTWVSNFHCVLYPPDDVTNGNIW